MYISTSRVAKELQLSRRRVTELVRTGSLDATLVAGRWVIDASEVAKYRILQRANGRPWDPNIAWEIISELSGQGGNLSSRAELRLLNTDSLQLIAQVQRLIDVEWFEARNVRENDPHLFQTGDSAVSSINHHVVGASKTLHAYTDLDNVSRHFDATSYVQGNLAIYTWRDGICRVEGSTPYILIAIDAARSTDARVRAAGIDYVEQELTAWQEIHSQ